MSPPTPRRQKRTETDRNRLRLYLDLGRLCANNFEVELDLISVAQPTRQAAQSCRSEALVAIEAIVTRTGCPLFGWRDVHAEMAGAGRPRRGPHRGGRGGRRRTAARSAPASPRSAPACGPCPSSDPPRLHRGLLIGTGPSGGANHRRKRRAMARPPGATSGAGRVVVGQTVGMACPYCPACVEEPRIASGGCGRLRRSRLSAEFTDPLVGKLVCFA